MPKASRRETGGRRCSQACDNCKRKKEKCDEAQPCSMCAKRNKSCRYSDVPARTLRDRKSNASVGKSTNLKAIATTMPTSQNVSASEAPVPRAARLLSDGRGKYNYIGDSASLSFLQSARLVVASALGDCHFTSDSLQDSILEQLPKYESSGRDVAVHHSLPNPDRAEWLANEYLAATGCLLDLFDAAELISCVRKLAFDPDSHTQLHRAVLYLVLAIGAQMSKSTVDEDEPEGYFTQGREQAYSTLNEAPSVQVVQSFSLIAMYLLGAYRTDTAFMNLGIALRAAYTLGLHRPDMNFLSETERRTRSRGWKSIRVLDIFMSAATGRPPASSDLERDVNGTGQLSQELRLETCDDKFTWAMFRLCAIGEQILIEVYKKRSVSTLLVEKICKEYREWTKNLPELPTPLENEPQTPYHVQVARVISAAHLIGAYYWSIILLTRPFLLFHITMYHQHEYYDAFHRRGGTGMSIPAIAEACIDAAIKGLDIIEDVLQHGNRPRRLPVVLNALLNSALTMGIAVFGDFDKTFPLTDGLQRAERALEKLEHSDQQARRFLPVVHSFSEAAHEYVAKRDHLAMKNRSNNISKMFGCVNFHFTTTAQVGSTPSADLDSPRHQASPFDSLGRRGGDTTVYPFLPMLPWEQPNLAETFSADALATLTPFGLYLSRPATRHQMRPDLAQDFGLDGEFTSWLERTESTTQPPPPPHTDAHSPSFLAS